CNRRDAIDWAVGTRPRALLVGIAHVPRARPAHRPGRLESTRRAAAGTRRPVRRSLITLLPGAGVHHAVAADCDRSNFDRLTPALRCGGRNGVQLAVTSTVAVHLPADTYRNVQEPVGIGILALQGDRREVVDVVPVRLANVAARIGWRRPDLSVEVGSIAIGELEIAVGGGHGVQEVAEARTAMGDGARVPLGVPAVLGNEESDVEACGGSRYDRGANRHRYRLPRGAIRHAHARTTLKHARIGRDAHCAPCAVGTAPAACPDDVEAGDPDVTTDADVRLGEPGRVSEALASR